METRLFSRRERARDALRKTEIEKRVQSSETLSTRLFSRRMGARDALDRNRERECSNCGNPASVIIQFTITRYQTNREK